MGDIEELLKRKRETKGEEMEEGRGKEEIKKKVGWY